MHTTAQTTLDGLSFVLGDAFPAAQIWADRIPQGMETGAFFIRQISGNRRKGLGLLYAGGLARRRKAKSNVTFEITCFPAADVGKEEDECRAVQEELLDLLDLVPTADGVFLRGEDVSASISDGVLVVTVRFQYSTLWIPEDITMQDLRLSIDGNEITTTGGTDNVS